MNASRAPQPRGRPFGRTSFVAAVLCLVSGVLLIRLAGPVAEALRGWPKLRSLLVHPWRESEFVLRNLSETFPSGLVLVAVGVLLLLHAVPRGIAAPRRVSAPLRLSGLDGAALVGLPVVSVGLFVLVESGGLLKSPGAPWAYAAVLLAAAAFFARRDRTEGRRLGISMTPFEAGGLLLGTAAAVALFQSGANAWQFSFIGDEWDHWTAARAAAAESLLRVPWLSLDGVVGFWPVAVTGWQALLLRLFGETNTVWRLSMALLLAASIPPLYLTIRHLLAPVSARPRLGAAFGVAVFVLSEQIVVWARIAKPHAAFVPPVVFAAAAFLGARERRSRLLWFATGAVAGLGLLLSPLGPVLAVGTVGSWLVLDALTVRREERDLVGDLVVPGLLVAAGFALAAAPFAVQTEFWRNQWLVNVTSTEPAANRHLLWPRTVQSFFLFLSWKAEGHFLWRNAVDPATACFAAAGFGALRFLGPRNGLLPPVALLVIGFLTGGVAKYGTPPSTRMMVVMVPVALLAAAGFSALTARARALSFGVAALVVPLIGVANLWKLENFNPYFPNRDWRLIEMQRIAESPPSRLHVLVLPREDHDLLRGLLEAYGWKHRAVLLEGGPGSERTIASFLRRGGRSVEVRAMDPADAEAARPSVERAGGRIGPPILNGIPERGAGVAPRLFALTLALNE
ncbi:MAG TPA: glycosyltransferase family 39 protein [Thermoanaerobaculia bacterium]|nr:glycosyltransferase family 39 protein [Thermoanaerobaculia bacterium]